MNLLRIRAFQGLPDDISFRCYTPIRLMEVCRCRSAAYRWLSNATILAARADPATEVLKTMKSEHEGVASTVKEYLAG